MEEKAPNKWEIVEKKRFSQAEFVAHIKRETGYSLNAKSLRDWRSKGLDFFLGTKREQKSVGSGRKTPFQDVEDRIYAWVESRWSLCRPPTVAEVMVFAESELAKLPADAPRCALFWFPEFSSIATLHQVQSNS
jgi:hypothetical protein